jgi:hypothetical protein
MQNFLTSYHEYIQNLPSNGEKEIYLLGIILFSWLLVLIIFQVTVHEGGHCFFGILTGYRFLSLRILAFTIVHEAGRYRIAYYNTPGSFGQCLMQPPEIKNRKTPFVLYFMGGVIADAAISASSAFFMLSPFDISFPVRIGFMITSLYTFGSALVNGIPNMAGYINNDGTNLCYLLRDKQAVTSAYLQWDVITKMTEGKTYKDLPVSTIQLPDTANLANPIISEQKYLECYYFMDLRQWEKALNCLNSIEKGMNDRLGNDISRYTLLLEKLFLYIKLDKGSTEIEELYNSTKRILKKGYTDINITRVRLAYELYIDHSGVNKSRIGKLLERRLKSYPYKGEAVFCAGLIRDMLD